MVHGCLLVDLLFTVQPFWRIAYKYGGPSRPGCGGLGERVLGYHQVGFIPDKIYYQY